MNYRAAYQNGNILSEPKLCASNYGTMISVRPHQTRANLFCGSDNNLSSIS